MKTQRKYNWKPDHPDIRDLKFSGYLKSFTGIALPDVVDLRSSCSPIVDQGREGSCTANALGSGSFEFAELKDMHDKVKDGGTVFSKTDFTPVSRQFLYYNERAIEGTIPYDSGAQIRDGVKVLAKVGVCREQTWPYDRPMLAQPGPKCYLEASKHRIKNYYRVEDLLELRAALALGFPVAFGFMVYESFESAAVASSGKVPMPDKSEQLLGGHAVLAVGYDNTNKFVIVRNSWGMGWGDQGYFYMPYDYINPDLTADFWVIEK